MLKRYVFVALLAGFGTAYGMEKESAKPAIYEYVEDARQLQEENGLYFSVLPKDILGIVQYYRLAELLDREIEKALGNKYEKALKNIAHLAQAAEYVHLFNNPQFIDGVINRISSKFGQIPQEVAQAINTLGVRLWIQVIRPDQIRFLEAAYYGDLTTVQQLIAQGVNVNARNKWGETALIRAAENKHPEVVKMLIGSGALVRRSLGEDGDINAQSTNGRTALMWAAYGGDAEMLKELIAGGANVNACDNSGWTTLMMAANRGHAEIVKELIGAGANINARSKDRSTALMRAASYGHTEVVKMLIAVPGVALERRRGAGANVDAQDIHGCTALMEAVAGGHIEVVKELIAAKANVNTRNKSVGTALDIAKAWRHPEIIKLLEAVKNTEIADVKIYVCAALLAGFST